MGLWELKLIPENANFKAVGNTAWGEDSFCEPKLPSIPTHAIELNKKVNSQTFSQKENRRAYLN